jgi:hypothetical protein
MTSDLRKTGGDFHGTISAACLASLTGRAGWPEGSANYNGLYPEEYRKRRVDQARQFDKPATIKAESWAT